jgi:N-acetylmuramoyl-L-alanine amidase
LYSPSYSEKAITLRVAKAVGYALGRAGIRRTFTRRTDRDISLRKRIDTARKQKPDLFLSIHITSSNLVLIHTASGSVSGEAGFLSSHAQDPFLEESRKIARAIGDAISEEMQVDVSYKEYPLPVLGYAATRAIMVELPAPEFFSYDRKAIRVIASAIVKGIQTYEEE